MVVEIVELLSLGTSKINHFRDDGTEIIDLEQKGEKKWNAFLSYLNNYNSKNHMKIHEIEDGRVWLVSR